MVVSIEWRGAEEKREKERKYVEERERGDICGKREKRKNVEKYGGRERRECGGKEKEMKTRESLGFKIKKILEEKLKTGNKGKVCR